MYLTYSPPTSKLVYKWTNKRNNSNNGKFKTLMTTKNTIKDENYDGNSKSAFRYFKVKN